MTRIVALLSVLLLVSTASAQVRHAQDLPLGQLWNAANTLGQETDSETVWAGYAITRQMHANSQFGWYSAGSDRPVLAEILGREAGARSEDLAATARRTLEALDDNQPLVAKQVAILFEIDLRERGPAPERISRLRLVTLDAPGRLGTAPILWGGNRTDTESLDFLEPLLSGVSSDIREEVVTAIGAHDSRERVMPLLAEIVQAHGSSDVGEAARHWLADHISVAMGLRPATRRQETSEDEVRRSALYALVNVEEGRASELLVRLVRTSPDTEIRRLALIQLAHLDGRAGESALLGMAGRYLQGGG